MIFFKDRPLQVGTTGVISFVLRERRSKHRSDEWTVTELHPLPTVLSIELRRNRLDLILKQNLSKGLSHALQRALNDSTAHAQVSVSYWFSYSHHTTHHYRSLLTNHSFFTSQHRRTAQGLIKTFQLSRSQINCFRDSFWHQLV